MVNHPKGMPLVLSDRCPLDAVGGLALEESEVVAGFTARHHPAGHRPRSDSTLEDPVHPDAAVPPALHSASSNVPPRLIVVGFDEIVANKYLPCIAAAIEQGHLESYAVIDLASQRTTIEARLQAAPLKPAAVAFVPDREAFDAAVQQQSIDRAVNSAAGPSRAIRMYIATEVRAHLPYLQYCVDHGISALVEKPVIAPLSESGRFAPETMTDHMRRLIQGAEHATGQYSVMTLSRYHQIYNDTLISGVRQRMERWETPLTSLHLRAAGGVWNTQPEYASRDDHPYRYGYGMLMHGAYHYLDLACQLLDLNTQVFPSRRFDLELSSFSAWPADQHQRITGAHAAALGDVGPLLPQPHDHYGETDVTAAFRLRDADTGHTVTLGTLSFEQTTPSIRTWPQIPAGLYNKNGRTSAVEVEAQVGTLYSSHVHCYDVPRGEGVDRIDAFARVTERANAALIPDEQYVAAATFDGLFHSDSNRALMQHWLAGTETRSALASHLLPMRVTEALARSIRRPGATVSVPDFAAAPPTPAEAATVSGPAGTQVGVR